MNATYDMEHRHDPDAGTVGDCWRACIATVTGTPIAEVPHFVGDHHVRDTADGTTEWLAATQRWLAERFGHICLYYDNPEAMYPDRRNEPSAWPLVIWSGQSPRGDWGHAVVGSQDGKMIHDPHPSRDGVTDLDGVFVIVRLEDWKG